MKTAGWKLLMLLPCLIGVSCEYLMGGHLDNSEPSRSRSGGVESSSIVGRTVHLEDVDSDADSEEITTIPSILSNDDSSLRYSLPFPFAFNGGRPFSLEKDPITGKIDYEKAPSVKAVNYTNRYSDEKEQSETRNVDDEGTPAVEEPSSEHEQNANKQNDNVNPNEINPYLPNFHDFLNLPVHYSSDKYGKDKYPLISNSYANTKVQSGSSSYSTYNHRPYHRETTYYYPTKKPYVPKTTTTTMTMTTTTTTTSTTPRYVHPTTRFSTTSRPLTTSFTTTESPTVTSTVAAKLPSTNVATTTKAPPITTWKPLSTSIRNRVQQTEGYDDTMHYMDMLQASIYGGNNQTPNNVVSSQKDTLTKPSTNNEDYDDGDGYEDYGVHEELGEENDYVPVKEVTKELPKITTTTATPTSTVPDTTVAITTRSAVRPSTAPSLVPTTQSHLKQQENIFLANPVQLQVLPHRPVTSMPLDNDNREVHPLENVIDGRRPIISNVGILESSNKPSHIGNQRPVGLGSGIVVESTSNIIVPPGQDTVSFVLGNRQNVDDKYYSTGTAIGESPYGDLTGIDGSFQSGFNAVSSASGQINFEPQKANHESIALPSIAVVDPTFSYSAQKWRSPNSPPTTKISNEIEPSKVAVLGAQGPPHLEEKDEIQSIKSNVAFPAAEGGDFVTFPNSAEGAKPNIEEHIVIINEADGSIREITPTTTGKPFVDPAVVNNDGLPQLSESLTPPAKRPRPLPPYYFHYQHSNAPRPDYPKLQRLPLPPRGKLPPPVPLSLHPEPLGLRRRPYSPDSKLPNILPQFRPNAKASHGHRDPETIGTITATQPFSTRVRQPSAGHLSSRRPLPPLPSHLQRLNPPPPPIHSLRLTVAPSAKMESVVPLHQDAEVKRYRVPVSAIASRRDEDDRPSQNNNYSPIQKAKLHVEEEERPERYSEEPPHVPPRPPLFPKRRTADSPQVETLQMIQQRTELEKNEDELNFSFSENVDEEPDKEIDEETADYRKTENQDAIVDSPVYVVYPVNTAVNIQPDDYRDKDESVVVGTRGPHRPLPPENLLQNKEEDEKIKVNDQSSLELDLYKRPITVNFSYPIDRHDSSLFISGIKETPLLIPSDQRQQEGPLHTKDRSEEKDDKDTSVNVIPYLQDFVPFPTRKNGAAISATLHRVPMHPSSTPIAYVYTPTAQASHQLDIDIMDEGTTNVGREDEKQILLPSQQPSSSSSSAPSPQNFMAPFVASVSAEAPAKNGWSVVVLDQSTNGSSTDEQDKANHSISSAQTQTETAEFDVENFKPQLFGGFKPIYEFPTDDGERSNHHVAISAELETSRHIKETSMSAA